VDVKLETSRLDTIKERSWYIRMPFNIVAAVELNVREPKRWRFELYWNSS
jgi:hypothetical protein